MSSTKKRALSPSPPRSKYDKYSSLPKVKRKNSSRRESESSDSNSTDSSSSSPDTTHSKKRRSKKKRRHRSSSSDSSPSPKKRKKEKKKKNKHKKEKKKKKKHKKEKGHNEKKPEVSLEKNIAKDKVSVTKETDNKGSGPLPRIMKPMTKEEWEKQQSVVRKVYDPETGRNRLVKGDGEILEEIVSKDRHKEINKQATRGDGAFFQSKLGIRDK